MTARTCPTPTKIAYQSKAAANGAKHVGSGGKRMRSYLCDGCGKFHLASWTKEEFGE